MTPAPAAAKPPPALDGGRVALALFLLGLGVQGLIKQDFPVIWAPVPRGLPGRGVLVDGCALVSLLAGCGLLTRRGTPAASRWLLVVLLGWWLWFRVPPVVAAPRSQETWSGWAETAVFVAAAGILVATSGEAGARRALPFATGPSGVRLGRFLYGCALLPFGTAHFVYLKETVALVPPWLPVPSYWAYLTGIAFLAAGAAVVTTFCGRLAARLSAVQLGLFTLLVWVPIVARGHADGFQWNETVLSGALTAAAWVVAESYRPGATPPSAARAT